MNINASFHQFFSTRNLNMIFASVKCKQQSGANDETILQKRSSSLPVCKGDISKVVRYSNSESLTSGSKRTKTSALITNLRILIYLNEDEHIKVPKDSRLMGRDQTTRKGKGVASSLSDIDKMTIEIDNLKTILEQYLNVAKEKKKTHDIKILMKYITHLPNAKKSAVKCVRRCYKKNIICLIAVSIFMFHIFNVVVLIFLCKCYFDFSFKLIKF